MKKERLKELMEDCLVSSKELLLREGKLMPIAFVFGDDVDLVGLTFRDNEDKTRQLALLRELVSAKNAYAIFVIVESWYVTSDKKELEIEPAKHPMRKECIFLVGECEEGNITIMQTFDRNDGEIVFGEKIEMGKIESLKFDFGIVKKGKQQNEKLRDLS